ncbi:CobW C-terminal domain-containing protein [Pedobacter psychrodurus]|uniref:GTP-binding protein n=1 Tax=Pedobacter psychrodurus TaxID=2530456 RepID=UPI002938F68F|nr:GTP-binding protein [Pedobacter psychrodurus]
MSTEHYPIKRHLLLSCLPEQAINFSQAGGSLRIDLAGVWWASMHQQEREQYLDYLENRTEIDANWDNDFGDRKNELVFIGQEMNGDKLKKSLEYCLLTDTEVKVYKTKNSFKNPFEHILS